MNTIKNVCIVGIFISLLSGYTFGQKEIGKIFTSTDANKLFGKVVDSKQIKTEVFKNILNKINDYVLVKIKNGQIYILNKNRDVVYPKGASVKSDEVFNMYSVSKMEELLNSGGMDVTTVDDRDSLITVSNGKLTIDNAFICPPDCY